jgi:hypothetical protein
LPLDAATIVVAPLALAVIGAYWGVIAVVPLNRLATWWATLADPSKFVPAGKALVIPVTAETVVTVPMFQVPD